MKEEIREFVRYCDLEERLTRVPASATVRGLLFENDLAVLKKAGKLDEFHTYFPEKYAALKWYPVTHFLQHHAVAGAILSSPEEIHTGMRKIGHHNSLTFFNSLLGKMMMRLLSRDPKKLLRQGAAGRRQSNKYGFWEINFTGTNQAVMSMVDEYLWIESSLVGAAEGTFELIGRKLHLEVELDSPFQGRHLLTWE